LPPWPPNFTTLSNTARRSALCWHGFRYHGILFGKPRGGNYHWIDNHIVRATRYIGKFTHLVEADAKIQVFNGE
jgi:hypothetical protein